MKTFVGLLVAGMFVSFPSDSHTVQKMEKFEEAAGIVTVQDDDGRHGSPHVKDPAECRKFCYPPGDGGERPDGVNEAAEGYECQGEYCARASHEDHGGAPPGEEGPGDGEEDCKPHFSCNVYCSEVCCKCLRECI